MRYRKATVLGIVTAMALCLAPRAVLGQEAENILGAYGAIAIAKNKLDVSQSVISTSDLMQNPNALESKAVGAGEIRMEYDTRNAQDCRFAAATAIAMWAVQVGKGNLPNGQQEAHLHCINHRIELTAMVVGDNVSWEAVQYRRSDGAILGKWSGGV